MSVKQINVRTNGSGAYTYTRDFKGVIHGISIEIGDLSTPDVDVTDSKYSKTFLSVDGVAADTSYVPSRSLESAAGAALDVSDESGVAVGSFGPAVCMGTLSVAVTGGGASKKGKIYIVYS